MQQAKRGLTFGRNRGKISTSEKRKTMLREYRLLDDEFMWFVFDNNKEATELVLRIILGRNDISVKKVEAQKSIANLNGHVVRLDILAVDENKKRYNIEVQRADHGAVAQRARFNSSILDTSILKRGVPYEQLPETYVIFITEKDVMGKGKAMYQFDRIDTESGERLNDGSHIMYVNGAYVNDENAIGKLMHDFRCKNPADMHFQPLREKADYLKNTPKGEKAMSKLIDDLIEKSKEKLIAQGRAEGEANAIRRQVVTNYQNGKNIEEIAAWVCISVEEAKAIINELSK